MAKLVLDWANIRIILLSASIYRYIFAIGKQNEFSPRPKRRFILANRCFDFSFLEVPEFLMSSERNCLSLSDDELPHGGTSVGTYFDEINS